LYVLQVLNAVVGVWQESNAEKALEALKELQSEHAKVVRDGKLVSNLLALGSDLLTRRASQLLGWLAGWLAGWLGH
jgi:hypothetical protein